jgi:hypothetical protein
VVEVVIARAAAKSNPSAEEGPAAVQPAQHETCMLWDATECVSREESQLRSLSCMADSCSLPLPPTISTLDAGAAAVGAGQTGSHSLLSRIAPFLQQKQKRTSAQHASEPSRSHQHQRSCLASERANTVAPLDLQETHSSAQHALLPYTMQTFVAAQGSNSETAEADSRSNSRSNSTQLLQELPASALQHDSPMLPQSQAVPTRSGRSLLLARGRRSKSSSPTGCPPVTRGRSCSALSRPHALHGGFRSPSPSYYGDTQLSRLGSAQPGRTHSYHTVRESSCSSLGRPSGLHGASRSPSPAYGADTQLSRLSSAQQSRIPSYQTLHEGSCSSSGRSSAGHAGPAWALDPNSVHGRALQTISSLSQQRQKRQSSDTSCLSVLRGLCSPSSKAVAAHAAPCSTEVLPPHLRKPAAVFAEHAVPNFGFGKAAKSYATTRHPAADTRAPPPGTADCSLHEPPGTDKSSPDSNQEPVWAQDRTLQGWWKQYTPGQLCGEPPATKLPQQKQKQKQMQSLWQRPKLQAGQGPGWGLLQDLQIGRGSVASAYIQHVHQDAGGQAQMQTGMRSQQQDTADAEAGPVQHDEAWSSNHTAYNVAAAVERALGPGQYRAAKVFARDRVSRTSGDGNFNGLKGSSSKKGGKQGKVSTDDTDTAEQAAEDAAELQALLDEYYESQNDNLLAAYMDAQHRIRNAHPEIRRQDAFRSSTTEYEVTEQDSSKAQRRHSLSLLELLELHLAAAKQKQQAQEQQELQLQQQEACAPKPLRQLYTSALQHNPQTAFYVALDREMHPEAARSTQPTAYQAAFAALVAAWRKLHAAEDPSAIPAAAAVLPETGQGAAGDPQASAVSTDVFPYDWWAVDRKSNMHASQTELDEQGKECGWCSILCEAFEHLHAYSALVFVHILVRMLTCDNQTRTTPSGFASPSMPLSHVGQSLPPTPPPLCCTSNSTHRAPSESEEKCTVRQRPGQSHNSRHPAASNHTAGPAAAKLPTRSAAAKHTACSEPHIWPPQQASSSSRPHCLECHRHWQPQQQSFEQSQAQSGQQSQPESHLQPEQGSETQSHHQYEQR